MSILAAARRASLLPLMGSGTRRSDERGQSAVELALVLPVLMLITLGIVDFGRLFYTRVALVNASREGARYCALNRGASAANLTARVVTSGTTPDTAELGGRISGATVSAWIEPYSGTSVTGCPSTANGAVSGAAVTVQVSANFRLITPGLASVFGGIGQANGDIPLRAYATMMVWA